VSASLSVVQQGGLDVITPADFEMYRTMAAWASKSQLVPEHFKGKPEDSMIAMLMGREMGIPPMIALQKGFVVKGKYDVEVKVKVGVAQARVPDFDFEIVEQTETKCVVKGGRAGKNQHTVTYTIQDAEKAGLLEEKQGRYGKYFEHPGYHSNPKDQLMWRAVGRLLNLTCAGALFNIVPMLAASLEDEQVEHEPSEATVVAGDSPPPPPVAVAPAAPVVPAAPAAASAPIPEDWLGRFCAALAAGGWCGGKPPADHKNARAKWLKSNGDEIARVASLFYDEQDPKEAKVERFISIPPGDYERLALWLEQRNAKRVAGAQDGAGTEPTATQEPSAAEVVENEEAPPPAELFGDPEPEQPAAAEPTFDFAAALGTLEEMRFRTKGARRFYESVEKNGSIRHALIDEELLVRLGYTKQVEGKVVPVSQWLDRIAQSSGEFMALTRALLEIKDRV